MMSAGPAYAIPVTEAPAGSIIITGDSYNYGDRPEIKLTLDLPQTARDVIEIGLDPDETTLHIKQDSTLIVETLSINLSLKVRNREIRASALINASPTAVLKDDGSTAYYGDRHLFFHGSENSFKNSFSGNTNGRDGRQDFPNEYYGPIGDDDDITTLFRLYNRTRERNPFNASLNSSFGSMRRSPSRNNSDLLMHQNAIYRLGLKTAGETARERAGATDLTLEVFKGQTVDFNVQLWSDIGFVNTDTRLRSYNTVQDWGRRNGRKIEQDDRQRQIVSLFDGDPIPLNQGAEGQEDILDLLSGYAREEANGTIVADLDATQMINMWEQNYKYETNGNPRSVYDLQDFVFLVTVAGSAEVGIADYFDYVLVKIDIPAPMVVLNPETGDPYVDEQGNYIDGPLPQEEGDPVPNIIYIDGSDTITFDEAIYIDPETYDPSDTYKFTTPNGIYGSVYKLVYVANEDLNIIIAGAGTDDQEVEFIQAGEEVKMDEIVADSLRIPYVFEIVGLEDPTSPHATSPENVGPYRMMSDSTYGVSRKVIGFSTMTDNLQTPRGSFAKLFIHRKFTYNESTEDHETIQLTYDGSSEYEYTDVSVISGMRESGDGTIVKSLPITISGGPFDINDVGGYLLSEAADYDQDPISTVLSEGTSGEEHFSCYNYLAQWGTDDDTGLPVILGYHLYLPNQNRDTLRVYAPPTGTLQFENTTEVVPVGDTHPNYSAIVLNTYPKAKTFVRNRSVATDTSVKTNEVPHVNGNNLKIRDEFGTEDEQDLGGTFPDGDMLMELVHWIDYNNDGIVDDREERILDSKPWILSRAIIIKGKVNTIK